VNDDTLVDLKWLCDCGEVLSAQYEIGSGDNLDYHCPHCGCYWKKVIRIPESRILLREYTTIACNTCGKGSSECFCDLGVFLMSERKDKLRNWCERTDEGLVGMEQLRQLALIGCMRCHYPAVNAAPVELVFERGWTYPVGWMHRDCADEELRVNSKMTEVGDRIYKL
jgi:hypothetical protein